MTEREIYITLAMRHVSMGDPIYNKGIKEKVRYFSHTYKLGNWKYNGHPTPPGHDCFFNCSSCWDKYMKEFIHDKEDQCNL